MDFGVDFFAGFGSVAFSAGTSVGTHFAAFPRPS